MKYWINTFFSLLLLFAISVAPVWSQCPEGIVTLSSDEEILAFAKTYPNCTALDSSLIIGPKEDMAKTRITDISALANLTSVNGDFVLKNNPWLRDIDAIAELEIIAGDFDLQLSKEMKTSEVNLALIRIGGDLKMSLQAYKAECKPIFKELIKIGGGITIYSHEIHHIMFPSLWKLGGGIWNYSGYAHFVEGEFPNLESVGGRIELNDFKDDGSVILPQLRHVGSLDIPKTKYSIYMGQLSSCKSITINGHDRPIRALQELEYLETLLLRGATNAVLGSFEKLSTVEQLDLQSYSDTVRIGTIPSLVKADRVTLRGEQFAALVQEIDTIAVSLSVRDFRSCAPINNLRKDYDSIALHIIRGKFDNWDLILKGKLSYLSIEECKHIKNMEGLDLSQLELTRFKMQRNDLLEDVTALGFAMGAIAQVSLISNPKLKSCQSDWICQLLQKDNYRVDLKHNHEACSKTALMQACPETKE